MSRLRNRQCFPILDAGSCPKRASLYTVDFGTRKNRATSVTVKISFSVDGALSTLTLVVAAMALFMTDMLSVGAVSNFSCQFMENGVK